jgi:hypothetical protein
MDARTFENASGGRVTALFFRFYAILRGFSSETDHADADWPSVGADL